MLLLSVIIFKWRRNEAPIVLTGSYEVSGYTFFQRGSMREAALFASREVVGRIKGGMVCSVEYQQYMCHVQVREAEGLACAVITDREYPQRVAFSLIASSFDQFFTLHSSNPSISSPSSDLSLSSPSIDSLLSRYQQPEQADKIIKIQKELDSTKEILVQSIDQLLERGEKLEDLAQRSNDLSYQSKLFLDKSKELNSCCTIL
eukprot:TRINITY_DN129_c0_g1_i1.p1 TRINITY_DN129_c0_g1~~TRINITY_DN129_c0_g1_i1.p1  ORF type:complete len:203 (+),score=63.66 TRINITY_DN129_c0_g1_i1:50-658(+)